MAPMVHPREEFALVMNGQDKKLYAFGGYDGNNCLDSIEAYDFTT
jgi:N-acetylneuraminic acid mutarotase